ncbi:ATPase, coupled to transmembrane movement of substances isoform X1 [Panicum miliaceum]|uniref:ATPase, coupled to transmembrane movement of substances isoform X1 n=1 Tax=Panicum miliaceum TaxID=4540 RepID=A0A3L6TKS3_PANMI|nr:ATPase, coupled to transmembrane movement of substances isoform X1 [Panicum miliaceum]
MDAARFRRASGHVPQDDAMFLALTVEVSLVYSARLRLRLRATGAGGGTAGAERAQELMAELGLQRVAAFRVTDVSGGERRRVSIGVDLVHDLAVLLLDEPTSELDSGSALHIVKMLRDMATAHGKTIVLTIHQSGFRILELIDRVVLLADVKLSTSSSMPWRIGGHRLSPARTQHGPLRPGAAGRQGHGGASPWVGLGPGWWRRAAQQHAPGRARAQAQRRAPASTRGYAHEWQAPRACRLALIHPDYRFWFFWDADTFFLHLIIDCWLWL